MNNPAPIANIHLLGGNSVLLNASVLNMIETTVDAKNKAIPIAEFTLITIALTTNKMIFAGAAIAEIETILPLSTGHFFELHKR